MNHLIQTLRHIFHLVNPRLRFPIHPASDHYDPKSHTFFNTPPTRPVSKGTWQALWQMIRQPEQHRPNQLLPMMTPDWATFLAPSERIKMIWFGHSSILIRVCEKTLFLDPVYYEYASPIPIMMRRFQPPPAALTELPPVDYILYTHAHYDHLDHEVVQYFAQHSPQTQFIAPLGLGTYLRAWGISAKQITELDWQQCFQDKHFRLHATRARHDASRSAFDGKKSLWLGYILQTEQEKIFFSGDSTYAPHFAELGEQFGGFDLALIENGQYNENWRDNHMHPEQTVQAARDLNTIRWMPIHWGAYPLAPHTWDDPVRRSSTLSDAASLVMLTPRMGEVFDATSTSHRWWETLK